MKVAATAAALHEKVATLCSSFVVLRDVAEERSMAVRCGDE
jgi:hypothetical protein